MFSQTTNARRSRVLSSASTNFGRAVPVDRRTQTILELNACAPSKLTLDLLMIKEIPPVVARPIRHSRLQATRLPEGVEDRVRHLFDAALLATSDVVRLADPAAFEYELDRTTMVLDVHPPAPIRAVLVERQRAVVQRVRERQRDRHSGLDDRCVRCCGASR